MIKDESYDGLPMPRRVFSVASVSLAVMMAVMDVTIMNLALPTMSEQMHLMEADTIWVVNSYQIAIIMCLLAMSSIGEIYSYKKVYLVGVSIFTIASLSCALSTSFMMLVISRLLQGVGAAAMMSINMTLLRLSYPKHWLGKGIGLNATIVAIASVIGPSLAALILSVATWHWLFYINIPLGVITLFMGYKSLPENIVKLRGERAFPKRDILLNALFFGSMIMILESISHGFGWPAICAFLVLFVGIGRIYIRRQLKEKYPLFPIDLLRIRLFSLSVLTSIASFTAQMLAMVSVPFFFQQTLGLTESETGFLFTAWPVSIMFAAPLAGSLIGKVNAGIMGGFGLASLSVGIASLALLPADPSYLNIVWRLALCGFGFGIFQSPNNNVLITSAPPSRSGSASGMLAMARLTGQTSGATLVALMFHFFGSGATSISLWTGACIALFACIISLSRLKIKA